MRITLLVSRCMRTTLTIDPAVAALAERIRRVRGQRFQAIVDQALAARAVCMAAEASLALSR